MEVRRIGAEDGFIREITDLRKRVRSQETRASGNIVIRETLKTTDPETGVATIVGQLPDGSYGIQPFVYDITPPPVASSPVVSAVPGVISVTWDGQFVNGELAPKDFTKLNIVGHKMNGTATVQSAILGEIYTASNIVYFSSDVIPVGETWTFSFEAEDYNTNRAEWSARSLPVTMESVVTDAGVNAALEAVNAATEAAQTAADDAQSAADTANTAAANAAQAAQGATTLASSKNKTYYQTAKPTGGTYTTGDMWVDTANGNKLYVHNGTDFVSAQDGSIGAASSLAASKGKTIIQSTAPSVADQLVQNLWIDTTGGANTPKRWDTATSKWITITDKAATDAASAAVAAQTKADTAFNNAATAATAAGNAQTTADGKNRVWYQTSAPAGTAHKDGDLWFDTANGNKLYLWKAGTTLQWTVFQDTAIGIAQQAANNAATAASNAQTTANNAQTAAATADSKAVTAKSTADTAVTNAQTAQTAADKALQDALTANNLAASKGKVLYQSTAPTGVDANAQTLWIDTTSNLNTPKRWTSGTTWVAVSDKVATDAAALAATKGKILYQDAAPTGADANLLTLWINTTGGANTPMKWVSGTTWVSLTDKVASDAAALAATKGKILFQTTAPTGADASALTLWIDTTNGANTPKKWVSGTTWAAITDKVALDAATAAANAATAASNAQGTANTAVTNAATAQTKADQAFSNAANAATAAGNAQTTADAKNRVWYQDDPPAGTGHKVNDIWFDTNDGNKPYRWTGTAWVVAQDAAIAAAQAKADAAFSTSNGKNTTYYQTNQPTGGTYILGDLWFDTDDNYKLYTYTGSIWQVTQDAAAAKAQAISAAASDATTKAANAQSAAISAAAADASTKATNAQSAAINAAAADAKSKADAAQSAATTAAAADAKAKADAAQQAAITAAANTAQLKADGAQQAAIDAAAADAKSKADAAQAAATTAAAADAKAKADAAQAAATSAAAADAKSKADAAQAAAIAAAATDATNKVATKNASYYQTAQPTGGTYKQGDLWFDTDDNYKLYTYTGSIWQATQDAVGARQAAISAAATDAQTKADTARQAAITAAATDASSKAATAEANAKAAAATDAQSKADAAKQAAIDAAAVTAQLKADGAKQSAIDAAALTAQQKADAAKQAAIDAASADAASKAAAAQAAAIAAAASDASTKATNAQNAAISAAASDATSKVDIAQRIAIDAKGYSKNPSFEDWTSTYPTGFAAFNNAPTKETSTVLTGKNAMRFNLTDATTQAGVTSSSILSHAPNLQYVTLELDVRLDSGTSFGGSGVLIDWTGMTGGNRATVSLATEIPSPEIGKWYRLTKVVQRPTTATGTFTGYNIWLMGQYSAGMGTQSIKNIVFDWFNIRPSTVEEITSFGLPATVTTLTNTVNTKTRTYYQGTSPGLTGNTTGDLWFDTANGNKAYVWNGAWTSAQDTSIATAQGTANSAVTAANGKNKVIYSTSPASGTTGYVAGDTWFQRDASNNIIGQWEFTTSWQVRQIDNAVIANLNAAKINAGTLDVANRIAANSITVNKVMVGDFTNIAVDGNFSDLTKKSWTGSGTVVTEANAPNKLKVITAASGNNDQSNVNLITVTGGEQFYGEVWVYGEPTNVGGGSANLHMTVTTNDGVNSWPTFATATRAAVSGQWVKLSGSVTLPANAKTAKVEPAVSFSADAVGNTYYFREVVVRRKNTGELIVDGAIKAGSAIIANGAIGNAQIADLNADKITAGTIAAARLDAETIKSKLIEASYLVATDIFAPNSVTSASGIFGTMDASVINAGTIAAARLDAEVVKSKLIEADYLVATDIFAPNSITSASGIFGTMDASVINAGLISAARLDAEVIRTKLIDATDINAVDIIAQNSITATNGLIASLDASKITVGTLAAARIGAKSIGVDKLLVQGSDNLVVEGDFSGSGASWELPAGIAISATAGRNSLPAMVITNSATLQTSFNVTGVPKVAIESISDSTNAYRVSMWVSSSVTVPANGILVNARFRSTTGTYTTQSVTYTTGTPPVAATIAANTWVEINGLFTAPANTISVAFSVSTAAAFSTGVVTIDQVSVARAATGELIVDGAVTATKMAANSITATNGIIQSLDVSKVTAGTMSGSFISAKSMTTDKLVISSTDNLVVEANFSNNGSSWGPLDAIKTINATAGRGTLPALRVTNTAVVQTINNLVNRIPVGTEDRFRGSFYVKSNVALAAGTVVLGIRAYTTATASTTLTVAQNNVLVSGAWTLVEGYSPALPANTIAIEFYLTVTNNATTTITDIDYVAVTRAADGKLVVDGAIDGKIITGAQIRTAASGARITLDSSGLQGWDANGVNYLSATSTGLAVTGTLGATGDGVDYSVYNNGVYGTRPVYVGIGGAMGRVGIGYGGDTWPYPSPLTAGSSIPGIVYKPTTVPMYDLTSITARDGVTMTLQRGVTQAEFDTWANTVVDGQLVNARKQYMTTQMTLNEKGVNFSKYVEAPEFRIGGVSMSGGSVQVFTAGGTVGNSVVPPQRIGGWTARPDASTDNNLFYVGANGTDFIAINDGVYDIHIQMALGTATTARSFLEITKNSDTYGGSRQTMGANEDSTSVSLSGVKMIKGQWFNLGAFVGLPGPSINYGATLRITKTAAPLPVASWGSGNIIQTGDVTVQGDMLSKPHYAQFYSNNFVISGASTPWDSGTVTEDTGRSRNNNFAVPGPYAGSVGFTQSGWYQISHMMIPTAGNPFDSWSRLFLGSTMENLVQAGNRPQSEMYLSTVPIYIASGDYVRSTVVSPGGFTANTTWKIVKFPWTP